MERTYETTLLESNYDKTIILIVGKYTIVFMNKLTSLFQEFSNVGVIDIKGLNKSKWTPCYLGLPIMYDENGKVLDGMCAHIGCNPPIWKIIWMLKTDRLLRLWKDKDWEKEYLLFPIQNKSIIKKLELNPSKSLIHNKNVVVSFANFKTICMGGEVSLYESSIQSQIKDIIQNNIKLIYIMDENIAEEHKKYEYLIDLKIDSKDFDDMDKVKDIIEKKIIWGGDKMRTPEELFEYVTLCKAPCSVDIYEHILTLKEYASKVQHVTEFGVRTGNSTVGLLSGEPERMVSYDINDIFENPTKYPKWKNNIISYKVLKNVFKETNFEFIIGDTLDVEIEMTDLLFIDTAHNYIQLQKELELHHKKVKRYIIFHDTETFKDISEDGTTPGIMTAIEEFLDLHKEWIIDKKFTNNNGLLIIKRG